MTFSATIESPTGDNVSVEIEEADHEVPSWEEVARRYGRTIYNFAYRLSGDPDDANDLTQDVLLRVRRGLPGYKPITFEGWLWRITRNAFLDEVRRRKRRQTFPLPEGFSRNSGPTSPAPEEALRDYRLTEDVQQALMDLPYDFREAVVLSDVVGLSYQEVADSIGVPVGTIRSRIHRGRKQLRKLLPGSTSPSLTT